MTASIQPDPDAMAYVHALREVHTTRQTAVTDGGLRSLFAHEAAVAALDDRRRELPPGLPTVTAKETQTS